ncbi:MAG: hypothetical protein CVT79_12100 [Alphaproteobacteria bacterium HGW-Alphaproteobacteria-18]|nr:MAG: hypothetical protein CVT79_12100 [Alphaproteobacteria bacterium HGW-Alphaproteobacteria-18]
MRVLFMLGAAMALGACATVTKGTDDTVKFESTPPGATVSFKEVSGRINQEGCVTPCTLEINRKFTYSVEVAKEGYQTYVQLLEPKLSGDGTAGMAGNILLGGVIGAAVDASTGAMNDLKPNPMIANLVALTEAVPEGVAQSSTTADIGAEITAAADEVAAVVEDTAEAVGKAVTGSN